jgi:hypothetical protein
VEDLGVGRTKMIVMGNFLFQILMMITLLIMFTNCEKPEIYLLCKNEYTDEEIDEVYLVKNYPKQEKDLNVLIQLFNQDLQNNENFGTRTFVRQSKNIAFDFALGDDIDYEKNECLEIDNMDILCEVSKVKFHNGGDTIIFNYFK